MSRPPSTLPLLVRVLLAAPVSPAQREAVLGDFEEELARRRGAGELRAWLWLLREALLSVAPWLRYRLERVPLTRTAPPLLAGMAVVALGLQLLNTAPVLEAVRDLPAGWGVAVAPALNLLAAAAGGLTAGRLAEPGTTRTVAALAGGLVLLAALGPAASPLWLAALVTSAVLGVGTGRLLAPELRPGGR